MRKIFVFLFTLVILSVTFLLFPKQQIFAGDACIGNGLACSNNPGNPKCCGGLSCQQTGENFFCRPFTPSPTPTKPPTPTPTPGKACFDGGQTCRVKEDCCSQDCVNNVCTNAPPPQQCKAPGAACFTFSSTGVISREGDCCGGLVCNSAFSQSGSGSHSGFCVDRNDPNVCKPLGVGCQVSGDSSVRGANPAGNCCTNQGLKVVCDAAPNSLAGTCIDATLVGKDVGDTCTDQRGAPGTSLQTTCRDGLVCRRDPGKPLPIGTIDLSPTPTGGGPAGLVCCRQHPTNKDRFCCSKNINECPPDFSSVKNPCPGDICETAIGNIGVKTGEEFVQAIFGAVLGIAGGIAVLLIIYSGYVMTMSQGNPEKIKGAQETLTSAIVGLVFVIFAAIILQVIGIDILHLPGFEK